MSRPGTGVNVGQGPELVGIDADRDDVQAGRVDAQVGHDVVETVGRYGHDPVKAAGHPVLHAGEGIKATHGEPLAAVGRMGDLEPPVDGDRVVDGAQRGHARPSQPVDAVAQALVVVNQVKILEPAAERLEGPQAERERLGE